MWVPGGGRSHKIMMAHLPDALVSSGQSVNHPEMSESVYLLLSTLESTGGKAEKHVCWWRKEHFTEHPSAKACARCWHTIILVNFLLRNSTILRRRTNSQGPFITVLRYILTQNPAQHFLSHPLSLRWEKSTSNLVVKTHQWQPQMWENWLIKIQKCWWGMNSPYLLKKVNFWI